jgi:hypothetical protein
MPIKSRIVLLYSARLSRRIVTRPGSNERPHSSVYPRGSAESIARKD